MLMPEVYLKFGSIVNYMRKLFIVISILTVPILAFSQQISLDDIPSKIVIEKAKKNTIVNLDSLAVILNLNRRESRVKNFDLEFCHDRDSAITDNIHLTPAGEFPAVLGCPGLYFFSHQSNSKTSYYLITFFYDRNGLIIDKEILYMLVIP